MNNLDIAKEKISSVKVPVTQIALSFGANDIDGTIHRENILHDAGATSPRSLAEDEIIKIIREAGRIPIERGGNP